MSRILAISPPVILALCLALAPAVSAQEKVDIAGNWYGKGVNPQGQTYITTVEVSKHGDTYKMKWIIGGKVESEGFGILKGDVLSASYVFTGGHGVVVYQVSKEKLDGKWTLGDGKVQSEVLTRK